MTRGRGTPPEQSRRVKFRGMSQDGPLSVTSRDIRDDPASMQVR
ncbi:hypothetical protein Ae717Ps2_6570 [Pseudonocardia sp. Ae717_Ps2]|nr:hypothetical protein Ae717Ps2_6517 [Pseudonocardia sp. Ae717_Ps2]OLM28332.1 hypothetical protein Ae717Ps2_6534 [Pseudonocardia sp. Ae717_Ps2]OLM28350.1 hypothetical protein Ae717Ps2_6552 [Pseudonocardia sp. Ae717_Ps2]OLM28368.1 hypothetical protein Ae717Ps2_6570 [Pseudonocardia sp. Ae717_Ps2]